MTLPTSCVRQWRWKSNTWTEVETPIGFKLRKPSQPAEAPPAGAKLLPRKAPYMDSGIGFAFAYDAARPLTSEYIQTFQADLRDQWRAIRNRTK